MSRKAGQERKDRCFRGRTKAPARCNGDCRRMTAGRPRQKRPRCQPNCDMLRIEVHAFVLRADHAEALHGAFRPHRRAMTLAMRSRRTALALNLERRRNDKCVAVSLPKPIIPETRHDATRRFHQARGHFPRAGNHASAKQARAHSQVGTDAAAAEHRNQLSSTTCACTARRWGRTSGICPLADRCFFGSPEFWLRLSGFTGAIGFTRRCHSDDVSAWDLDPLVVGMLSCRSSWIT